MRWDLLDLESGNLIGRFSTEDEALEIVRAFVAANGDRVTDDFALGGRDKRGRPLPVVEGDELRERAMSRAPIYADGAAGG